MGIGFSSLARAKFLRTPIERGYRNRYTFATISYVSAELSLIKVSWTCVKSAGSAQIALLTARARAPITAWLVWLRSVVYKLWMSEMPILSLLMATAAAILFCLIASSNREAIGIASNYLASWICSS